jgi:autotransporter-associated beta strand protein
MLLLKKENYQMINIMMKRILAAGVLFGLSAAAQAASPSVWDGGHGSSANWSQKQNWGNNTPVPGPAYDLQFATLNRLTNNNDFAAGSDFRNITFNSGAGAFTLNGNAIDLFGGITNNSAALQTINLNLSLTTGAHRVSANSGNMALRGVLSGSGSLIKSGASDLTLTAANTYTNTTTVSLGGLIVNGSLQSKLVTVSAGARLGGTGTVQAVTMEAGSVLAAGNSPGLLNFNAALTLSAGSTNVMEIASSSLYDVLKGNGANTLAMNGTTIFDFTGNTTVSNGSTFAVLQNWGSLTTNGVLYTTIGLGAGLSLDVSSLATTGYLTVIPEPATAGMLGFGALVSIFIHHIRRWAQRR